MNRNTASLVTIATIAIFSLTTPRANAQTSATPTEPQAANAPETKTTNAAPKQTLYLHGFRSPSIGIEYRRGNVGLHTGLYLTNISRKETTRFEKIGVTGYFPKLDLSRTGKFEPYLSIAYVRGLNRDYRDRNGLFIEQGVRFKLTGRLEARLGTGILLSSGRRAKINPTPGISYSIPF